MNYEGMRAEIVELFLDAQRIMFNRASAFYMRRSARKQAESRETYEAQIWDARIGGATESPCPLCGGTLQHRPGNRFPIHLGQCPASPRVAA